MGIKVNHGKGVSGPRQACVALLMASSFLLGACGSDVGFRRFEVGPADPQAVYQTATEVVREFYTHAHGGMNLFLDEENLRFETGYIERRTRLAEGGTEPRVETILRRPARQKLYFQVIPSQGGVDVEFFACIEGLSIKDPDRLETPDDMWTFLKQDQAVEDLLFQLLLERLVEKGLLE
jgi:hypothetical protein